jgi:hypothetical protein
VRSRSGNSGIHRSHGDHLGLLPLWHFDAVAVKALIPLLKWSSARCGGRRWRHKASTLTVSTTPALAEAGGTRWQRRAGIRQADFLFVVRQVVGS